MMHGTSTYTVCLIFLGVYQVFYDVRFDVLSAVSIKIQVSWDVVLCQLVNYYRHFVGERYIPLQV